MVSITRRNVLKTAVGAATAASLSSGREQRHTRAETMPTGSDQINRAAAQDEEIKAPRIKFGSVEISRLIVGCNPFYGVSHFNQHLSHSMAQFYTPERVVEVLLQCNKYGINAFNYRHTGRCQRDFEQFQDAGGKMYLIVQDMDDPEGVVEAVDPLAIYCMGDTVDTAYRNGNMNLIKDYCKRVRQLGVMVGVGSHIPDVIVKVEEEGWDVDFYAGCVYNRKRTPDEIRKLLGGELPIPENELYLEDDPPRMYKVMRQIEKPCFAFKILAAGRQTSVERAFELAFDSLKAIDGIFVGMFPLVTDEVRENVYFASRYGAAEAV